MVNFFSPRAKTDIFTVDRRRTAKKVISFTYMKLRHTMSLYLDITATLQPIPLFVLYTRHPPSSNALGDPAWWTSSTG